MKSKKFGMLLTAAAFASIVPAAHAQEVQITQDGRPERLFRPISGLNREDIAFLRNAAIANMFEIQTSELARQKSTDSFVTEFAKEMISDHTGSQEELKAIAAKKGISLPQELPESQKRILMKLQGLSGESFDTAYEKAQKGGHAMTSTKFKWEIQNGKDQDVKGYAVKTLPVVTMHYKMAILKKTMMGDHKMDHGE